jgi:DNA-binding NarL/FixJ family response regulator
MRSISQPISVGIADSRRLVRDALSVMLRGLNDMRVVAPRAADPRPPLHAGPRVVLFNMGPREQDSIRVAAELRRTDPDARIIAFDVDPQRDQIVGLVNAGVAGFVMRDASFDDFVGTIRTVGSGSNVLPPIMTKSVFSQLASTSGDREHQQVPPHARFTQRERDVVALIVAGRSNKEIARRLAITTHTVKSHVRHIMEKLEVHTRLAIAAFMHRSQAAWRPVRTRLSRSA